MEKNGMALGGAIEPSDIYPRLVYDVGHSIDREYEGGEA